jgi:hypothetical protein
MPIDRDGVFEDTCNAWCQPDRGLHVEVLYGPAADRVGSVGQVNMHGVVAVGQIVGVDPVPDECPRPPSDVGRSRALTTVMVLG